MFFLVPDTWEEGEEEEEVVEETRGDRVVMEWERGLGWEGANRPLPLPRLVGVAPCLCSILGVGLGLGRCTVTEVMLLRVSLDWGSWNPIFCEVAAPLALDSLQRNRQYCCGCGQRLSRLPCFLFCFHGSILVM